ncbi:MAG: lycopene cyclase domain-containing protein [Actinomycetes bacterium]
MTYTQIALLALVISVITDGFVTRSRMLMRRSFWTSYAIILPFQLLTNWWLTSRNIVMYNPDVVVGWRIASAPVEDLIFGFALVLGILQLWSYWGKKL